MERDEELDMDSVEMLCPIAMALRGWVQRV
jgi:hypothetical protein